MTSSLEAGLFGSTLCKVAYRIGLDDAAVAVAEPDKKATSTTVVISTFCTLLRKTMLKEHMVFPNLLFSPAAIIVCYYYLLSRVT